MHSKTGYVDKQGRRRDYSSAYLRRTYRDGGFRLSVRSRSANGSTAEDHAGCRPPHRGEPRVPDPPVHPARRSRSKQELEDRAAQWRYEEKQWSHEERKAKLEWKRAQIEAKRQDEQEARHAQVNAHIELLKMYAANGHLDTHNADIEDLIRRIHGDHPGGQLTAEDRPELTDGQAPEARAPEADRDY